MSRPPLLGLRHLALTVRALEAMKRFYVDLLGFTVQWEPDADNVYLTSGTDNLALHRPRGGGAGADQRAAPNDAGGRGGALDHIGLLVPRAEDVDAWAAFLESRGIELATRPRTHRDGARSFYFADPDGNMVQIIWWKNG